MKRILSILALSLCVATAVLGDSTTWYVDCTNGVDSADGLTWATASASIQSAINSSAAGDTILVADGVYAPISTSNKAITIHP